MEQLYSNFGIVIIKKGGNFFLQYDSGEIVSSMKEIEISEQEARELQEQKDGNSLYNYMIKNLNDRI